MRVKLPSGVVRGLSLWLGGLLLASAGLGAAGSDLRLIEAVKNRNVEAVRSLLGRGIDVNTPQPDGATALHWAAHHDDQVAADLLMRAGANVNAKNELGATPLWLAAAQGSTSMVAKLLDGGANPNVALEEGETPLMAAARAGNLEVVKLLAARGADVNAAEHLRGQTALMWAAANERPEVVRTLVELRADINAHSDSRRLVVNTGLQTAGGNGDVSQRFAPPGVSDYKEGGFTPLLFAAERGSASSAQHLLSAGANVNDVAANGASALVIAAHSGHTALARLLLDKGADANATGAGYTALHAAVLRGDEELAKALLAHGADPNAPLVKGTPIRRASIDWALNHTWIGGTPYWLAARLADAGLMRTLAGAGANTRVALKDGTTPLMAAVGMGMAGDRRFRGVAVSGAEPNEEQKAIEAAKLAVELGADVNAVNETTGDTALHTAAARRLNSVIQLLVDSGAKVDVKNKKEQTPLAIVAAAPRVGGAQADAAREKTADLLRKLGAKE